MKKTYAAFDFDGTLSYRDTFLPFLWYVVGPLRFFFTLVKSFPGLALALVSKERRQKAKEALLKQFFKGKSRKSICHLGELYAQEKLPLKLRKCALHRLQWHLQRGDVVVLISANFEEYLVPFAKHAGIHHVLASKMQMDAEGKITGFLKGKNCRGVEKVKRLKDLVGNLEDTILYAYGDSEGDLELLSVADHPFFVAKGIWPVNHEEKCV